MSRRKARYVDILFGNGKWVWAWSGIASAYRASCFSHLVTAALTGSDLEDRTCRCQGRERVVTPCRLYTSTQRKYVWHTRRSAGGVMMVGWYAASATKHAGESRCGAM